MNNLTTTLTDNKSEITYKISKINIIKNLSIDEIGTIKSVYFMM